MTLDEFMEEFDWFRNTWHQEMYVNINGKQYRITGAYPESDAVVDPNDPDLREEENYRIVFEIEKEEPGKIYSAGMFSFKGKAGI